MALEILPFTFSLGAVAVPVRLPDQLPLERALMAHAGVQPRPYRALQPRERFASTHGAVPTEDDHRGLFHQQVDEHPVAANDMQLETLIWLQTAPRTVGVRRADQLKRTLAIVAADIVIAVPFRCGFEVIGHELEVVIYLEQRFVRFLQSFAKVTLISIHKDGWARPCQTLRPIDVWVAIVCGMSEDIGRARPFATPVLDEIEGELLAVTGETEGARAALANGDLDEALAAVVLAHDVHFAKTPARGYTLAVFSAARHPDCSLRLQALHGHLHSIALELREAGHACNDRDPLRIQASLESATQAVAQASAVVAALLESPLGQQIRRLHSSGHLDG